MNEEKKRVIADAQQVSKFFEIRLSFKISVFGHVLFERNFVYPPDSKGGLK